MACDLKWSDIKKFDYKKVKYEVNVGGRDRQIRFGVGGVLLLLSVFFGSVFLLIIGCALVASAYVRWCPAYSGLQQNTLDEENEEEKKQDG